MRKNISWKVGIDSVGGKGGIRVRSPRVAICDLLWLWTWDRTHRRKVVRKSSVFGPAVWAAGCLGEDRIESNVKVITESEAEVEVETEAHWPAVSLKGCEIHPVVSVLCVTR